MDIKEKHLPPLVFCALGAVATIYLPEHSIYRFASSIVAIGLLLCAFASCFVRGKYAKKGFMPLLSIAIGVLIAAYSHGRVESLNNGFSSGFGGHPNSGLSYEGLIVSDGKKTKNGWWGYAVELKNAIGHENSKCTAQGLINLYVKPDNPTYKANLKGQVIQIACKRGYKDLAEKKVLFVHESDVLTIKQAPRSEAVRGLLRFSMSKALDRAGGRAGPLLIALVLGIRDELDVDIADDFRLAGCAHILALSGQHVAILASIISICIGFALGPFKARAISCVLAIIYMYIVGVSPSVMRAVIMFVLGSICRALDRPQSLLSILCMSFLFSLIAMPETLHSLSFKLSYLAVLGMALTGTSYEFTLRRWMPFAAIPSAGFSALSTTAPMSLLTFGSLNFLSPLISAIAGLLVTALMWIGIAGSILVSIIPYLQIVSVFLCELIYTTIAFTMKTAGSFASINISEKQLGLRYLSAGLVVFAAIIMYAWPYAKYKMASIQRRKFRNNDSSCKL